LGKAQIGLITAIFPLSIAVGSVVGGAITDKWGRKVILFGLIWASIFFSASLILANTWQILAVIYGIVGFLQGGYMAVIGAIFMDITNPRAGATQFSVLTSLANVGEISAGTISGSMVTILGFGRTFLYSAWIFGPALLILYFIRLKKTCKKK